MKTLKTILIFVMLTMSLLSCKRDIDDVDETPIDEKMLLGGWKFTDVKCKINTPVMKNIAENVTEKFMQETANNRKFYFTPNRAYCVWSIDTDDEQTKRSRYACDRYILHFQKQERFFGNWKVPFFYVKNQTKNSMTFYLMRDEIVSILKDDGSIPNNIIDKIEDGICEMNLKRYYNPFWDDIEAAEAEEFGK